MKRRRYYPTYAVSLPLMTVVVLSVSLGVMPGYGQEVQVTAHDAAEVVIMTDIPAASPTPIRPGVSRRLSNGVASGVANVVLWDNGPLVNSPGTGPGGADESILQRVSLNMFTLGFGHQVFIGNRVADDFEITDPCGWFIEEITFYAYQTGSDTTSTITAVNYQIWDGPPGSSGSAVIFGDKTTNRLIHTTWSGIYRKPFVIPVFTNRPVMANTVSAGVTLPPGRYWLDWQADGTLSSGPWAPPITINGQTTTGDGWQSLDNGLTYDPARDSGTLTRQGFPFIIEGRTFGLLADKTVKIDGQIDSEGNIHANDKIEFKQGNPSTHTGNLTALNEIRIDRDQTIVGDAVAPKIVLKGNATVTGTASVAPVVAVTLPVLSFMAGGNNVTVNQGWVNLPPGSYGKVKVKSGGTLELSNGAYFFSELQVQHDGMLVANVTGGSVVVNVAKDVHLQHDSKVMITPVFDENSRYLTINGLKDIQMQHDVIAAGNLIAPNGKVQVQQNTFFQGVICAREIDVQRNVRFVLHGSSVSVPSAKRVVSVLEEGKAAKQVTTDLSAEISAAAVVTGFNIGPNYPNPFNPETVIPFAVPEAAHVSLRVYDVLGRQVAVLHEGSLSEGRHEVRWRADHLPTGVYLVRMEAAGTVHVRRMTLTK